MITSLPFHNGEVGLAYGTVALGASGGTPPYQWIVNGGALASGISLTSDGHVSGTPTKSGQFGFTVQVADSAGGTASGPGSIGIATALALTDKCAQTCNVEAGCTVCGVFGTANGGVPPYSYATINGGPPPGMGLNGLQLTKAFTKVGSAGITVRVTDKLGATGLVTASWKVFAHITFGGGTIPSCSWTGCSAQFPYSGGSGAVSVTITGWTYPQTCTATPPCPAPAEPTASAAGGFVIITVPGPGQTWGGGYVGATLTVVLTDQSPCGPGNCSTGPVAISITVATS